MTTTITAERPDTPDALALIAELEAEIDPLYRASRRGYSVEKLLDQGVAFFIVREDGAPVGCGGVRNLRHRLRRAQAHVHAPAAAAQGKRVCCSTTWPPTHATTVSACYGSRRASTSAPRSRCTSARVSQRAAVGDYRPDPLSLFYEKRIGDTRQMATRR
jgi:hypothetical protein